MSKTLVRDIDRRLRANLHHRPDRWLRGLVARARGCRLRENLREQVSSVAEKTTARRHGVGPRGRNLRGRHAGSARPLRPRLDDDPSGAGTQAGRLPHPQSRYGHPDAYWQAHADGCSGPSPNLKELERQREGIAKAKSEGRYKGRKPIEAQRRKQCLQASRPRLHPGSHRFPTRRR